MSESLIKLRVYKYSSTALNGCGEELDKVMVGGKITSCLDDTLDTAEISLNGVSESEPYKPLTKFVVALEQDNQDTQYFHYELRYDNVEKLSMSDNLYKHTLYLGNPAISCQKRTCDNFAISYRLKDVRLDKSSLSHEYCENIISTSTLPTSQKIVPLNTTYKYGYGTTSDSLFNVIQSGKYLQWRRNTISSGTYTNTTRSDLNNMNAIVLIDPKDGTDLSSAVSQYESFLSDYEGKKIQIVNFDSSNKYYGSHTTYFKSLSSDMLTSVDNTIRYYLPALMANTSNTYNQDSISGVQNSISKPYSPTITGYFNTNFMATKTIVKKTNSASGEYDTQEYIKQPLYYGSPYDETKYICGWYSNGMNFTKELSDLDTDYVVIGYGYTKSSDGTIIDSPIFMKKGTSITENYIDIELEKGYQYEITTQAYFGENGLNRYAYYYENGSFVIKTYNNEFGEFESNKCMLQTTRLLSTALKGYNGSSIDNELVNENEFTYSFSFQVYGFTDFANDFILLNQNTVPTCYDLFKKAQICSKTIQFDSNWASIDSNSLPYVVSNETKIRLAKQNIIEDKYYNKNLWEVFMQIGKYIHAKPYIRFYNGRYELKFKDYGISKKSTKKATTNSLFSNNNIENYISSLDSYLENYFEYGNEVEEYLKPTDNDGSSICTNDNAVLKTKYPIMEITGLYVSNKTSINWKDITDYIYEYNIYKILDITQGTYLHFKGNSIYYHLNGTQLQGLQYIEPSSSGDKPYAIKRIIGEVYGYDSVKHKDTIASIQVNDYIFKITYRTKDDVRFKTFKPDLRKFILNASNDNYPMQSQFSNQSDKVVDSNKYGNNTYGTLLRSGNDTLDYQEYITEISQLKDSGELYDLGNQYYVAKNTMVVYPTYVECEVEYSKDYNKLSEIIGIDSAPRFYEIAEDGSIKRNITYNVFFQISANTGQGSMNSLELRALRKLYNDVTYKYCYVHFKGAKKIYNTRSNNFNSYIVVPCVEYATGNTLTLECDMEDNFGAGENQIDKSSEYQKMYMESSWIVPILKGLGVITSSKLYSGTITTRQSIQYCDIYGKADLVSFAFLEDIVSDSDTSYITSMPKCDSEILNLKNSSGKYITELPIGAVKLNSGKIVEKPFVLDKDSRETIGINYSIHLLTNSDRFVLSNNVFRKKNAGLFYWVFLSEEVNKMERDVLNKDSIIDVKVASRSTSTSSLGEYIDEHCTMAIQYNTTLDFNKVKAIAFAYYENYKYHYVIARNVSDLTKDEKIMNWQFNTKYSM